jgi:hypothetical protein
MTTDDRAFESPSAVGQYWLARSEGFVVESPKGRRLGEVEEVAVDPATGEGAVVMASRGVFGIRRETVPTDRVRFVLPWSETIVLGRRTRAPVAPARLVMPGFTGFHRFAWSVRRRVRLTRRSVSARVLPYVPVARGAVAREARTTGAFAVAVGSSVVPVARAVAASVARAVGEVVAWVAVATPVYAGRLKTGSVRAWRRLDAAIEARRDPPQRRTFPPQTSLRRD